jgi:hypothetical protein
MPGKNQYQRHKSHKISSGIAVGQFDGNGNVLSSKEVMEKRERKGLCRICGRTRTHQRSVMGTTTLITKEGECLEGWCLKCHTVEQIMEKPGVRARLEKTNRGITAKRLITPRSSVLGTEKLLGKHNSFSSDHDKSITSPDTMKTTGTEDSTDSLPNDGSVEVPASVECCEDVAAALSISSILHKMKKDKKNAMVQESGCLDLARSLADRSKVTQKDLDGALNAIICAMNDHPKVLEVQKMGCAALNSLTTLSDDAATNRDMSTKLAANGGVCAIIASMMKHLDARSLQREAMRVLRNILRNTQRNRKLCIMGLNEFEAVVSAMEAHAHSKSIQVMAWQILDIAIMNVAAAKIVRENASLRGRLTDLAKRHPKECSTVVTRVVKASKI